MRFNFCCAWVLNLLLLGNTVIRPKSLATDIAVQGRSPLVCYIWYSSIKSISLAAFLRRGFLRDVTGGKHLPRNMCAHRYSLVCRVNTSSRSRNIINSLLSLWLAAFSLSGLWLVAFRQQGRDTTNSVTFWYCNRSLFLFFIIKCNGILF